MAGTGSQDFDDILKAVARRTKQDAEIDDLGKALNIPSYDIQSAQKRNSQDHSHMGSLELLRDWVKTKNPSTMRKTLKEALKKIQREDILSACFPEVVAVPSGQRDTARPIHLPPPPADSIEKHGKGGPSQPPLSPDDSSGQHGEGGPSDHSSSSDGKNKLQNRTVRPANPSPDELDHEMQYVMWESRVKGNALVIGNTDFPEKGELPAAKSRTWADMDIDNMENLLAALGYNVRTGQNLSKLGMEEAVKGFTEQLEKDKPQSAVVYISSHGNETGIEGFDRNILPIPDLLKMFSGVLLGKPKVLIIDACWGADETSRLPLSASSSSSGASTPTVLPENADIFMIHSTSYGKKTWSYTTDQVPGYTKHKPGSWLVKKLCEVVYNNDRDLEDLDTIMLRVTTGVHEIKSVGEDRKDVGTQSTTVFKQGVGRKLFFYPGYPPTNV